MKINRGDSQDKGSQSRQTYHAAPAPAPKRPVQPDPDPQDLYEDAEGPDEYAEDDDDEPVRRRFPIGLVVLVVILAIVGIGGWKVFQFYGEVAGNGELGPEQTVTIEQGSTVADITNVLKEDGVIQYDWLFKLYAKYSGRASGLQYGDFTLRSGMDYNTILKTLSVQQSSARPLPSHSLKATHPLLLPRRWKKMACARWMISLPAPTARMVPISASMISGMPSRIPKAA